MELRAKNSPKGVLAYNEAKATMYKYLDNKNGIVQGIYDKDAKKEISKLQVSDITELFLNPATDSVCLNDSKFDETTAEISAQIRDDGKGLNGEHIWPQSALKKCNVYIARGDLHHLYPASEVINNIRSNYPFGNIDDKEAILIDTDTKQKELKNALPEENTDEIKEEFEKKSEFNPSEDVEKRVFEPREISQGNVARSVFYIALVYGYGKDCGLFNEKLYPELAKKQIEWFEGMRKDCIEWNKEDKPDKDEIDRCENIFKIQGNRNPFVVDYKLVDQIFGNEDWLNNLRKLE